MEDGYRYLASDITDLSSRLTEGHFYFLLPLPPTLSYRKPTTLPWSKDSTN